MSEGMITRRGQIWDIGGIGWRVLGDHPHADCVALKCVKSDWRIWVPMGAFRDGSWSHGGIEFRVRLIEDAP